MPCWIIHSQYVKHGSFKVMKSHKPQFWKITENSLVIFDFAQNGHKILKMYLLKKRIVIPNKLSSDIYATNK